MLPPPPSLNLESHYDPACKTKIDDEFHLSLIVSRVHAGSNSQNLRPFLEVLRREFGKFKT